MCPNRLMPNQGSPVPIITSQISPRTYTLLTLFVSKKEEPKFYSPSNFPVNEPPPSSLTWIPYGDLPVSRASFTYLSGTPINRVLMKQISSFSLSTGKGASPDVPPTGPYRDSCSVSTVNILFIHS